MLFTSFQFLVFFCAVTAFFFTIPHRFRWILLLLSSYYFYMCWKPEYLVLIIATTAINYIVGLLLEKAESLTYRKILLSISLITSLGILFAFKYWDFFSSSTKALFQAFNIFIDLPAYHFLLPVGISFYTFQTLSYTIDVYQRRFPAEQHPGIFALYVSFFPQLVAGPIERSWRLLPQFRKVSSLDYERVSSGLRMILWGVIKKVVIADKVAVVVQTVYSTPETYSGPYLILATIFFAFQIYCDFSAYSDIAVGCARILGYDLMINFRQPYFSKSMKDFWRRWHISLSTWFRDYLYIPLGGNRTSKRKMLLNISLVFLLCGLWHGAAWTFVLWGGLHATFLIFEATFVERIKIGLDKIGLIKFQRLRRCLASIYVFIFVLVGWVFFRSESIDDAFLILKGWTIWKDLNINTLWSLGLPRFEMITAILSIFALLFTDWLTGFRPTFFTELWKRRFFRWSLYLLGFYSIVFLGVFKQIDFIYFQF